MQSFRKKQLANPKKTSGQIESRMAGEKDGRTDRQTLIHRTLPETAGGPAKTFKGRLACLFAIEGTVNII